MMITIMWQISFKETQIQISLVLKGKETRHRYVEDKIYSALKSHKKEYSKSLNKSETRRNRIVVIRYSDNYGSM